MGSTDKPQPRLAEHERRLARPLTVADLLLAAAVACAATSLTVCWPRVAANLFASDAELGDAAAQALRWTQAGLLAVGLVCGAGWWRLRRRLSGGSCVRLGHALALALGFVVGGILAEAACRVGNRVRHGFWWRSPIPAQPALIQIGPLRLLEPGYYSVPVRNDFTGRVTRVPVYVNRLGLKGSDITEAKHTASRVLCVGGSTTYGWYLSNSEMYPAKLQGLLDQRYQSGYVEVVNAGVPACTTRHAIQALERRWFRLQPDIVLYYAGYNDVWHAFAEQYGGLPRSETQEPAGPSSPSLDLGPPKVGPVRISLVTLALANPIANSLARWRAGSAVLEYSLNPSEAGRNGEALKPELLMRYRRDLDELADLCESRGVKLVLATFAGSWNPHDPSTASPARWARAAADMPWVAAEPMYAAMETCRTITAEVARERGLPLVRMEQKIAPDESNFYDTIHLSPRGAALLAQGFFDLLEEQDLLSGSGHSVVPQ